MSVSTPAAPTFGLDVLRRLRELVDEYNLRDPRKLLQVAQRQGVPVSAKLAKEALAPDIGRQILRPPPRATGKAAATRPDSALRRPARERRR